MLKDRKELEIYLEKKCERVVFDKEQTKRILSYAEKLYNLPTGMTMNMIAGRVGYPMVSKLILFYLLDAIDSSKVEEYFTPVEIEEFKKTKYTIPHEIKFPLHIKIMQVSDDQWIGATTAGFYLGLLRSSLIRYNVNTQRVLKKIIKNEEVEYKIDLNKSAVENIKELLITDGFIPNTLTLNISDDSNAGLFYYNEEDMELVINSIDFFDILDGYHRLIAICDAYNFTNEHFDYPMELRITNFSEQKAKQFIFQEDQKTLMRKIDSASMNPNSESNFVVERLNTDMDSNFRGIISRNAGKINYSEMSAIINKVYFKNKSVNKIEVLKYLKSCLNCITDEHTELLDNKISTKLLYALIVATKIYEEDSKELFTKANKIISQQDNIDISMANLTGAKVYNYINNFVKEV